MKLIKWTIRFLFLLIFYSDFSLCENREEINEKILTDFSLRSIYRERLCSLNSEFNKLITSKCKEACNIYAAEFAVSILGHGQYLYSAQSLVDLIGLEVDGGLSEVLSCEILDRAKYYDHNKILLKTLENTSSNKIRSECKRNVQAQSLELGKLEMSIESICKSEKEITDSRKDYLNAIYDKSGCSQYE